MELPLRNKKGDRIVNLIERDKYDGGGLICPAPTLEEILEDLRKDSEPYFTVFKEWCEGLEDRFHGP